MQIERNSIVSIFYKISDSNGLLLEAYENNTPFMYLQGNNVLLPAIEASLEGKQPGEEIELILPPEQAFGYADENLVKIMPLKEVEDGESALRVGEAFTFDDNENLCWVVESIENNIVCFNANNPWAGKTLHVHIKVVAVDRAFEKETIMSINGYCGPECCCYEAG